MLGRQISNVVTPKLQKRAREALLEKQLEELQQHVHEVKLSDSQHFFAWTGFPVCCDVQIEELPGLSKAAIASRGPEEKFIIPRPIN